MDKTYVFFTASGSEKTISGVETYKEALMTVARWIDDLNGLMIRALEGMEGTEEELTRLYNALAADPIRECWCMLSKIY